jgi:hypothetical protein
VEGGLPILSTGRTGDAGREAGGMTHDYDPTLKAMVETAPESWLPVVGRPPAPVTVEDADLATVVSGAVDKVLRVDADPPYLLHLDFQAGHDSSQLPLRFRL